MAICPECNKQELKEGESLCPHCANKKTNFWAKTGEVAVTVAAVAASIIYAIITKKSPPKV